MPWMQERQLTPELMDQPGLDAELHRDALKGLSRINLVSNSAGILWPPIRELARRSTRPLRILDIATGGGDNPVELWRKAQREGVPIEIEACDQSDCALEHAQELAGSCGADVRFFQRDVLSDSLPNGYDVVMSSLFMHHLSEDEAVRVLRAKADASRNVVLVNDLLRSPAGLALAYIACHTLSRSHVVRTDGPRSVRAAYTIQELRHIAEEAGMGEARFVWRWPFRYLMTWKHLSA